MLLIELAALSEVGGCVFRGNMTQYPINVTMEENALEWFGEVVCFVNRRVDAFEDQEVALDPFTKYVVSYIHVPRPASRLLSVGHSGTCIVVFI